MMIWTRGSSIGEEVVVVVDVEVRDRIDVAKRGNDGIFPFLDDLVTRPFQRGAGISTGSSEMGGSRAFGVVWGIVEGGVMVSFDI